MNKISILIISLVFVVFINSVCVYAEETTEDEEITMETAQTYIYDIEYRTVEMLYNSPIGYARGSYGEGTVSITGKQICAYWSDGSVILLCFDSAGYEDCGMFIQNLELRGATLSGKTTSGPYNVTTGEFENLSDSHTYTEYNTLEGKLYWKGASSYDDALIKTSIPIFSSLEQAEQFMNNEIDESSSMNFEDVVDYVYDSPEVPIPKNLKVYQENGKYFIQWEQTVEELEKITLARVGKTVLGMEYEREDGKEYPGRPVFKDIDYEPTLIQKIDLTDMILEIKSYFQKCEVDEYRMGLDIEVKNRWDKKISEVHYSTLVHAVLTISYTYEDGLQIEVGYEETDKDGNYITDSDYNDIYDNSGLIDDGFTVSGGGISSSNFISNIVNGFGLLGDSGLMSFLKGALSCLPSFVWELLGAGLSIMIIIAIFKVVIG